MAKVKAPLYSYSASGKIGERLVFSNRASGQQARFQRAQKDVLSSSRIAQRSLYSSCVSDWDSLDSVDKELYNDLARQKNYTGYNLFMKTCLLAGTGAYSQSYFGIRDYGNFQYGGV